ncbi:Crp/Fnr family transcriptional regulator [Streptomyces sp. NPDC048441]|uniref:Crp/Fnr family transcriptional regulator n=1 Tax=Streptomyces sp. NPDC048441 TaxID=3365552 RepID=UPI00371AABE5
MLAPVLAPPTSSRLKHEEPPAGFRELLKEAAELRGSRCQTIRLSKREYVYTLGQRDENVYLICDGWVKVTSLTRCGKTCLLEINCAEDIIGESCLVDPVRDSTAVAMEPTRLLQIPLSAFLQILTANTAHEEALRYFTRRLTEQKERITQLVTTNSEQRLAATLMQLSRRLGIGHGCHRVIHQQITQQELSEIVGTTRSRIGYFLKKFRRHGLISSLPGASFVIDESRLCSYFDTIS